MAQKRRSYLRRIAAIQTATAVGFANPTAAQASNPRTFEGIAYNPETLEVQAVGEAARETENGSPRGTLTIGEWTYEFDRGRSVEAADGGRSALAFDLEHDGNHVGELTSVGDRMHGLLRPAGRRDVPGEISDRVAFTLVDERRGSVDETLARFERFRKGSR